MTVKPRIRLHIVTIIVDYKGETRKVDVLTMIRKRERTAVEFSAQKAKLNKRTAKVFGNCLP